VLTAAEYASGANALAMAGGLSAAVVFITRWKRAGGLAALLAPISPAWRALVIPSPRVRRLRYYFFWWGVAGAALFVASAWSQPYYFVRAGLPAGQLDAWLQTMPAVLRETPSRQAPEVVATAMGVVGVAGLMKLRRVAERMAGRRRWLVPILAVQAAVVAAFSLLPRFLW
jgi:hypothetical protein